MKRVVVIGGGFAGSLVAKKLEREFDLTLIDTKDYFEFTPGVLRFLVEPERAQKIQVLHSQYLKMAKIVVGEVKKVDERKVYVEKKELLYDYLVICSGSRYELPFKEQGVVVASRGKSLIDSCDRLKNAKRVVLVGGGLVGVELAGEIVGMYGGKKKITIIHSGEQLIERNGKRAVVYVERYLKGKGVEVVYGKRVQNVKNGFCLTDKGTKFKADMVFLCTGITPNFEFLPCEWLDGKGVGVNEFLQVRGREGIFAAGDVTSVVEEKTAQNAEKQAEVVVRNICALDAGNHLERYINKRRPILISLGEGQGVLDSSGLVLTGRIPAVMKLFVEWNEMRKKR
ncbi:MAG: FAD-dependent oxidoreductase [archaeon]